MYRRRTIPRLPPVIFLLSVFCAAPLAWGQAPDRSPTVHVTGQHELKLKPQKLRLTLAMRAEGADAKSAIRTLTEHKDRVKKELLALRAEESSIEFGATRLTSSMAGLPDEASGYSPAMIAQMLQGMNVAAFGPGAAGAAKPLELPTVYQAAASVRAEWPLPTVDPDALALLPETLKAQIRERDLAGEKNKAQFDAAQQERMEEIRTALQDRMGYYSSETEAQSLVIVFVAHVDEASRKEATKAAFDQAAARAATLASATGRQMGGLVSLRYTDMAVPSSDAMMSQYMNMSMYYATYASRQTVGFTADEATDPSSEGLRVAVVIEAEFALE